MATLLPRQQDEKGFDIRIPFEFDPNKHHFYDDEMKKDKEAVRIRVVKDVETQNCRLVFIRVNEEDWYCTFYDGEDRDQYDPSVTYFEDIVMEEIRKQSISSQELNSWIDSLRQPTTFPNAEGLSHDIEQLADATHIDLFDHNGCSKTKSIVLDILRAFSFADCADFLSIDFHGLEKHTTDVESWVFEADTFEDVQSDHRIDQIIEAVLKKCRAPAPFSLSSSVMFIKSFALVKFLLHAIADRKGPLKLVLVFSSCCEDTLESLKNSKVGWFVTCKTNRIRTLLPFANVEVGTLGDCLSRGTNVIMSVSQCPIDFPCDLKSYPGSYHICSAETILPLCYFSCLPPVSFS